MPTARTRANRKYNEKAYEQIAIRVHKGTRTAWREHAERLGMSLAGLIVTAVTEYLDTHPTPASHPDAPEPDITDP